MPVDVCTLVRRDHVDLDRALVAMLDPGTDTDELRALVDVFKLALAVHVASEAKVFALLAVNAAPPEELRLIAQQVRAEHGEQRRAADVLATTRPGSEKWYTRTLQLRVLVLDHTSRADALRSALHDHVPVDAHGALASEYATERLRMLARSSPFALARAELPLA